MKEISNKELSERARKIKYLFTDVDGTLTDGCVYYSPEGEELKKFSLRDGTGFFLLRKAGIKSGIITGENSPIVSRRAEKLKIDKLILNAVPKVETLESFLKVEGLTFEEIAYVGDDLNDVKLLQNAGIGFAVSDASEYAKQSADVVLAHKGGDGAFREAVELLLRYKGVDINSIVDKYL